MTTEQNIIQTALQAAKQPQIIIAPDGQPILLTPTDNGGWLRQNLNRDTPDRKKGITNVHDTGSLIQFIRKHKSDGTEIYINADFAVGSINIYGVLNGDTAEQAGYGDHCVQFKPRKTPDAAAWLENNGKRMNQAEFAAFLTGHAGDIVSSNPDNPNAVLPTGADVLDFALNLEYTEKTTFKQGYREQDGRINFTFQSEDTGKTEQNLKMYEKFGIAFTPFLNGDSFFVEAALKFRIDKNSGALLLWYELQQVHKVMELAARAIANQLKNEFEDVPVYNGTPA